MAKRPEFEIIASQYYIEMQMSVAQIARRLNVSEKTLFTWKKQGDWEEKRKRYLKSQYSTNQSLYELLHLVTNKAVSDFKEEGIMPDQKTLYFIMNMGDKLMKLKQFEAQAAEEKIEETAQTAEINGTHDSEAQDNMQEFLTKFFTAVNGGA